MTSSPSFLEKWNENEKQHFIGSSASGQVLLSSPWLAKNMRTFQDKEQFPLDERAISAD